METPESLVARNVAELRKRRGLTVRALSALLEQLGHKILPSGITKIENQTRAVGVADLLALAIALGVNPNRLLLPIDDQRQEIALTPTVIPHAFQAWAWARGNQVLLAAEVALGRGEEPFGIAQDDFRRHVLPADERLRADHTAVRAAAAVLDSVRAVLERSEHPEAFIPEEHSVAKLLGDGPATSTPAGLRAVLRRLVAEIDVLIGEDDASR